MPSQTQITNIEKEQKLDSELLKQLAKAIETLHNMED